MEETINLYEALRWMEKQKQPFRIEFIRTSLTEKSGGSIKVINRALVGANQKNRNERYMIGFKDMDYPENAPIHTYIYSLCFLNGKKIVI